MSLEAIQYIQNGPFAQYLETSKILGGDICEQSILVEDTFKALARFIDAMQRYRVPLIPHEELYFVEPIMNNMAAVRNFAREHDKSVDVHHLTYVKELDIILKPYKKRIITQVEELDDMHEKWLASWDETFQNLQNLILTYYKNGTNWIGDENVPPSVLLGDITSTNIMFEHRALIDEINKGEDIMRMLKHKDVNDENPVTIESKEVAEISQNKWKLENKRKQSLIITTAEIEDRIAVSHCEDCTIVIENKVHMIQMNKCKVITILIRSVYTHVDITECENCRLHFFAEVPKIDIKQSKNTSVYLSEKSKDAIVVTKKCSGTIVNMPFASGLLQSFKIPEEFVSIMIPNKGIETTALHQTD